jgi:hypothetical protein
VLLGPESRRPHGDRLALAQPGHRKWRRGGGGPVPSVRSARRHRSLGSRRAVAGIAHLYPRNRPRPSEACATTAAYHADPRRSPHSPSGYRAPGHRGPRDHSIVLPAQTSLATPVLLQPARPIGMVEIDGSPPFRLRPAHTHCDARIYTPVMHSSPTGYEQSRLTSRPGWSPSSEAPPGTLSGGPIRPLPHCGGGPLFRGLARSCPACPSCGLTLDRASADTGSGLLHGAHGDRDGV